MSALQADPDANFWAKNADTFINGRTQSALEGWRGLKKVHIRSSRVARVTPSPPLRSPRPRYGQIQLLEMRKSQRRRFETSSLRRECNHRAKAVMTARGPSSGSRFTVNRIRPLVGELERCAPIAPGCHATPIATAMDYMLKRSPAFTCFLEDGRICLGNNAAEHTLRPIALGPLRVVRRLRPRRRVRGRDLYPDRHPQNSTASILKPGSPMCCAASLIIRLPGSTSSCPGTGSDPKSPPPLDNPASPPWANGYDTDDRVT